MNISDLMLRHYINYVTVGWFGRNDLLPETVHGYRKYVDNMILAARQKGDLQDFQLGLEAICTSSSTDWESYCNHRYPYDAGESELILRYIRSVVAEELGCPTLDKIREVHLTSDSLADWWATHGR